MHWTPQQLTAFVVVAHGATVAEAADRLDLSIAAVSQRLAGLQQAMPQPLLFRDGRRLALTDAGRVFLGHAEQILATGREAELALSAGSPQHSTVVLGVFGSAAATIVPPAMRALAHGPVTVETREVGVDELGAAVATGTVDVGLGVGYPDAPEPPLRGVQTEVLSTEELLLAVPPPGTPGALGADELDDPERITAYANATDWILGPASSYFGRAVRVATGHSRITPRVRHEVTDTAVAIALAEAGAGITPVTQRMVRLRPTRSPLVRLPVPAHREVVVRVRTAQRQRASVDRVVRTLAAIARD